MITVFFWTSTPLFVSIVTFTAYTLLGNQLDAETAFTAIGKSSLSCQLSKLFDQVMNLSSSFCSVALFNVLRFPLNMLPQVISSLVEAHVSVKRISKFLLAEELDPNAVLRLPYVQIPPTQAPGCA